MENSHIRSTTDRLTLCNHCVNNRPLLTHLPLTSLYQRIMTHTVMLVKVRSVATVMSEISECNDYIFAFTIPFSTVYTFCVSL